MAVAQRMYARALFEAAQEAGRVDAGVRRPRRARRGDGRGARSCARSCATRRSSPPARPRCSSSSAADADELVRNFVRLAAEKGRAGELAEISEELDALVAQAQNRLAVELDDRLRALRRRRRARSSHTIEKASGRTVEATRAVDPSLIGGIVLQIGSHRADGSVRGRLERLRHELATT